MTAKEEAKRIFDQYYETLWNLIPFERSVLAKKCALIDINNSIEATILEYYSGFYREVKNELEKCKLWNNISNALNADQ